MLNGYDDLYNMNNGQDASGEDEMYLNEKLSGNRVVVPRVKPARFLGKSDYILLVILVVIIVITAMFLTFIGIICFYTRYKKHSSSKKGASGRKSFSSASSPGKKQPATLPSLISQEDTDETTNNTSSNLSPNSSSPNTSMILSRHLNELDNINEMDCEDTGHNYKATKKQAAKSKKLRKSKGKSKSAGHHNKDSLNSSTGSGSLSAGSTNSTDSSTTKPQYVLVNNSGSSGAASASSNSTTSNGVLLYRDADDDDADDDEFGLLSHPPSSAIRQFTSNTIRERERQQQQHQHRAVLQHHQQHHHQPQHHTTALSSSRYIHPSLATGQAMTSAIVLDSYESSNRSNSAAESIVESMTIDDSKSNNSHQDYDLVPASSSNSSSSTNHKYLSSITNKYRNQQLLSEPSSAYSSITTTSGTGANANNINSALTSCLDSDPFAKLNSLACMNYDESVNKTPTKHSQTLSRRDNTSLLSFRKTPAAVTVTTAHAAKPAANETSSTYRQASAVANKHATRTSFNL